MTPRRLFLDTNVYILGAADPTSAEGRILLWAGWDGRDSEVEIILSDEVIDQIRRVGRRVSGKDWAGDLLSRIWRNLKVLYVVLPANELARVAEENPTIPREDLTVYLTARLGAAESFVSFNHILIKALADATRDFEGLTPDEFIARYLSEQTGRS